MEEKSTYPMYIYLGGTVFAVQGYEAAFEAYYSACEFAEHIGAEVDLVDGTTGEVIASSDDETLELDEEYFDEDDNYEPDDSNLEMGYDPYMGCYTDDC